MTRTIQQLAVINKIVHPGDVPISARHYPMYCHITFKDGKLSISGVIGPRSSGNCAGSCGQIDMEFAHRNQSDDDKRYTHLTTPEQIRFANGWNAERWLDFLDAWKRWHLNDMRAECEHQRARGETYSTHPSATCPDCGYKLGSAWLSEEVPASVLEFLEALPVTDKQPAWV